MITPAAPTPAQKVNRAVILDDDYSQGLAGWTGLIGAGENFFPSIIPATGQGPFAMVVDTIGGAISLTANATKRAHAHLGIVEWWIRFTWTAGLEAGVEANSLRYLKFAIDFQSGDANRQWWEVRYRHWDEAGGAITPLWEASDGSANAYNQIVSVGAYELGYNQYGKFDFHDLVLRVDTVNKKWVSLDLDGQRFDMQGQTVGGAQAPVANFDNGMNFVVTCLSRSNNSASDPMLIVDRTRVEVS